MKRLIIKIIFIVAIGMVSYKTYAQTSRDNVPQAVHTAFSMAYPQAQLKNWKIKKDTCIATFKLTGRRYEAYYLKNGTWVRSERNIRHQSSLPSAALLYLKTGKYASWHVDDLKNVNTPSESLFLVSIDNNSGNPVSYSDNGSVENKRLFFDDKGKLIKVIEL